MRSSPTGTGRVVGLVLFLLFAVGPALALGPHEPPGLDLAVEHLCVDVVNGAQPDVARIAPLLDFVRAHAGAAQTLPRYMDAPGVYRAFRVEQPLQRLLRYLYNPDIPEEALKPFSLRSSRWLDPVPDVRRLWQEPWSPTQTVVLRGVQEDQTTPDQSTGGWYRMRLRRALILMPWAGGQVLLAVSVQDGPSEIGAKGYRVGPDTDWAYLYSDEQGLTKTGLGWVESRIQTNVSVAVYLAEPGQPVVNGILQWMRAGWAGLSVVKAEHVAASLARYERELRRVLDAPALPAPEELEAECARLRAMDTAALRQLARPVILPWLAARPMDGDYLGALSKNELAAILLREKIRAVAQ